MGAASGPLPQGRVRGALVLALSHPAGWPAAAPVGAGSMSRGRARAHVVHDVVFPWVHGEAAQRQAHPGPERMNDLDGQWCSKIN